MGTYQKKSLNIIELYTILETLAGNFLGGGYNVEPSAGDTNEDIMVKESRNEPLAFSGGSPEISRPQTSFFQTSGRKPKDSMLNCMRTCFFSVNPGKL